MSGPTTFVFLLPLCNGLRDLKVELEKEYGADFSDSFFEVDDPKEAMQVLSMNPHGLLFASDSRKMVRFAQSSGSLLKQPTYRYLLLMPKQPGGKEVADLALHGIQDFLVEPQAKKLIYAKYSFIKDAVIKNFEALEQKKEQEKLAEITEQKAQETAKKRKEMNDFLSWEQQEKAESDYQSKTKQSVRSQGSDPSSANLDDSDLPSTAKNKKSSFKFDDHIDGYLNSKISTPDHTSNKIKADESQSGGKKIDSSLWQEQHHDQNVAKDQWRKDHMADEEQTENTAKKDRADLWNADHADNKISSKENSAQLSLASQDQDISNKNKKHLMHQFSDESKKDLSLNKKNGQSLFSESMTKNEIEVEEKSKKLNLFENQVHDDLKKNVSQEHEHHLESSKKALSNFSAHHQDNTSSNEKSSTLTLNQANDPSTEHSKKTNNLFDLDHANEDSQNQSKGHKGSWEEPSLQTSEKGQVRHEDKKESISQLKPVTHFFEEGALKQNESGTIDSSKNQNDAHSNETKKRTENLPDAALLNSKKDHKTNHHHGPKEQELDSSKKSFDLSLDNQEKKSSLANSNLTTPLDESSRSKNLGLVGDHLNSHEHQRKYTSPLNNHLSEEKDKNKSQSFDHLYDEELKQKKSNFSPLDHLSSNEKSGMANTDHLDDGLLRSQKAKEAQANLNFTKHQPKHAAEKNSTSQNESPTTADDSFGVKQPESVLRKLREKFSKKLRPKNSTTSEKNNTDIAPKQMITKPLPDWLQSLDQLQEQGPIIEPDLRSVDVLFLLLSQLEQEGTQLRSRGEKITSSLFLTVPPKDLIGLKLIAHQLEEHFGGLLAIIQLDQKSNASSLQYLSADLYPQHPVVQWFEKKPLERPELLRSAQDLKTWCATRALQYQKLIYAQITTSATSPVQEFVTPYLNQGKPHTLAMVLGTTPWTSEQQNRMEVLLGSLQGQWPAGEFPKSKKIAPSTLNSHLTNIQRTEAATTSSFSWLKQLFPWKSEKNLEEVKEDKKINSSHRNKNSQGGAA